MTIAEERKKERGEKLKFVGYMRDECDEIDGGVKMTGGRGQDEGEKRRKRKDHRIECVGRRRGKKIGKHAHAHSAKPVCLSIICPSVRLYKTMQEEASS